VGSIHPGQPVSFTVDAYPGQVFRGEVGKIRLNATMTQNVVTYTVEVITDNSSGKLLPYLTANAQFELSQRKNVLTVPNAALRWFPQLDQVAPKFRAMADGSGPRGNMDGGERQTAATSAKADARSSQGLLWTQDGSYVRPVKVRVGLTDGTMTEVQSDDVKEGMEVIVGEQRQGTTDTGTTNPFAPQTMRRSRP
jgi:HlyD family secretion protein